MTKGEYRFKLPWFYFLLKWRWNTPTSVIVSMGDRIYTLAPLRQDLLVHEREHLAAQKKSFLFAHLWWMAYMAMPNFRFNEELGAYRAQWKWVDANVRGADRSKLLTEMANNLAGPYYGGLTTFEDARQLIIAPKL